MKKILIIAAAAIALIFSVWGFFRMRSETISQKTDILVSLPENPFSVLRVNKVNELSQDLLYNNNYWRSISSIESMEKIHRLLSELDSLKDVSADIRSIMENRNFIVGTYLDDSLNASVITIAQISANENTGLSDYLKTKGLADNSRYEKDIFLYSSDKNLLAKAVEQVRGNRSSMSDDSIFNKIYATAGYNVPANLFINMGQLGRVLSPWEKCGDDMNLFPSGMNTWSGFDIEISEDKMMISGFGDNSAKSDIGYLFDGQSAGENELVKVLPYNTIFFYHYSLSDFERFRDRLAIFRSEHGEDSIFSTIQTSFESPTGETPLLFFQEHFGGEIALGMNYMGKYVIIKLNNQMAAVERLKRYYSEMKDKIKRSNDGNMDIYELPSQGFAGGVFGSNFSLDKEFVAISGKNMIIGDSPKIVKYVASRNPNTQTLQCSPIYQQANKTLLSSSNLSIYADIPYLVRNAGQFVNKEKLPFISENKEILGNFESFGIQSESGEDGLNYQQFFLQYNPKLKPAPRYEPVAAATDSTANTATDKNLSDNILFKVELDAPARMSPQPVTNHYTGETEIAIQDKDNVLYLISSKGKILWKAQLSGAIIGDITQVDMLKNKKLQMAFVTSDKLFIVDRNGNMLKGFPKNLKNTATAGLSVFDYDNNLNYRFFYPSTDKKINLLRADGTTPADWKNPTLQGEAVQAVQYIRMNGKDYLLCADKNQCYYFDRKGNKRIIPEKNLAKSVQNIFYVDESYDNKRFVYSTPDGQICFVGQDNKVNTAKIEARDTNHRFANYAKGKEIRFSFFDKNGLTIYDKDFNLLVEEDHIKVSSIPVSDLYNGLLAVYDNESERCMVYDLLSTNRVFSTTQKTDFITICDIKPYKKTGLLIANGKEIVVYGF